MPALLSTFISMLALVLTILIFARVIISWTNPMGGGSLTAFIYQATEPILAPIRRIVPPAGGFDWSPMIALLLLGVLTQLFVR
ncbi:MAG TPA: YggT family protein [Candidatus Limnocylindria bacterium]|jgi:YggT family protein|nr:YggT family protein [Candidatus Limnocylindria bacterium]